MTTLTIDDFNTLFKPGQLPDLGYIVDAALSKTTTATVLNVDDATIKGIGGSITAIRTAAISPALAVSGSPYLNDIKQVTDRYATIPTYISAFVKPTAPLDGTSLAINVMPYTSIITYVKKTIHDFDSIMLFELVQQNASKTDAATMTALTTLIQSYITYLNNMITTFKLDNGALDKKYYRILAELEKTLTKMNMIVPSAKTIDIAKFVPLVEPYVAPAGSPPPVRATPDPVIVEILKSISNSINAFVAANKIDTINNPKTIRAINQLPVLISSIANHFSDVGNVKLLTTIGVKDFIAGNLAPIFPIPPTTLDLFDKALTKVNFKANLTKPTVGIIPFITTNYMGNFALNNIKKVVNKSSSSSGQTKLSASSFVSKLFEKYIAFLNNLINIFGITITDDAAIKPHLDILGTSLANMEYKLLLAPQPLVGGMKRRSTRRKRARRSRR